MTATKLRIHRWGRHTARLVSAIGVAAAFAAGPVAAAGETAPVALSADLVAGGLQQPVLLTHAPEDFDRVFVLERAGRVRIIQGGVLLTEPFIDLSASISTSGEGGLLGLAFHPDYACNGRFFVHYLAPGEKGFSKTSVIAGFTVSDADPNTADPDNGVILLKIGQPSSTHNGGWIGFGPVDRLLYVAIGDGGRGAGPEIAQDVTDLLLGKMLRLDVDGDDFPDDPDRNYAVPPGNPFVDLPGDDEIWSFGLRNPYRCAFDRETGDLWIGDVGQFELEEIDLQPASSPGGENYGWGCMEGTNCTVETFCACNGPDLTPPVHVYDHVTGGCAISGIAVYRGCAMPDLAGTVFFGDFCQNKVWSMRYVDGEVTDLQNRIAELQPPGKPIFWNVVAIGADAYGELYVVHYGGEIWKIVPADPPVDANGNGVPDACEPAGIPGDLDGDGDVDFADLLLLLNNWGPCGECPADIDGSGSVDFADLLTLLVNWS